MFLEIKNVIEFLWRKSSGIVQEQRAIWGVNFCDQAKNLKVGRKNSIQ